MTPRASGAAHAIAVGLAVGGLFLSFAAHQVAVVHGGNASGLVRISHRYFDKDPTVNERDDLRDALRLTIGRISAPPPGGAGLW